MSTNLLTSVQNDLNHAAESKSYLVQGGSGRYSSSTGLLHKGTFNTRRGSPQTSIYGSHESATEANSNRFQSVSGSSERNRNLHSREASKVSRHNVVQASPRTAVSLALSKRPKLYAEQLSAAEPDTIDSDSDYSIDEHNHRTLHDDSMINSKSKMLESVSGSGSHGGRKSVQQYESSQSDDVDSESSASESESEGPSSDFNSEHDEPSDTVSEAASQTSSITRHATTARALKRVVYFRVNTKLSEESLSATKQALQAYLPDAEVMLEILANHKIPYSDRKMLNILMSRIVNEEISEVLVADSSHLCSTKDGFSVFSWVCQKLKTKVFILPALQSL